MGLLNADRDALWLAHACRRRAAHARRTGNSRSTCARSSSDGRESFLDNGLGKLRFDEDHQGIQLGRLRAAWNQPLGEVFSAHVEASTWDDDDKNPIDLTEAYLEYRPYPRAGWRTRVRLGAFYPPMSLENRAHRLGNPLHDHAVGHQLVDRRRDPHRRPRRPGRLVRHASRPRLRPPTDRRGIRLERSGRHHARRSRFRLPRSPDHLVWTRGRTAAGSRPSQRKNCSTRSMAGPATTSARRCAISTAPCSMSCTTTIARDPTAAAAGDTRLRVAHEIRCGRTAHRNRRRLDGAAPGDSMAPRSSIPASGSSGNSIRSPRCSPSAWARTCLRCATTSSTCCSRGDPLAPGSEDGHAWALAYSYDPGEHWRFALEWLRVESDVPARAGAARRTRVRHRIESGTLGALLR